MTVITLSVQHDMLGGKMPTNAALSVVVYRGQSPATRISASEVLLPDPFTIQVIAGQLEFPLDLPPIPADCYWKIRLRERGAIPYVGNIVVPAGAGPVPFANLIEVIPGIALPTPASPLANELVAQVTAEAAIAVAARAGAEAARAGMVVGAHVTGDNLFLETVSGTPISAGSVRGPAGVGVLVIPSGGTVPPGTPSNTVIVQLL